MLANFTLALKNEVGLGNATIISMVEYFGGIDKLYETKNLSKYKKYLPQITSAKKCGDQLAKELSNKGMSFKCFWEEDYPPYLKQLSDCPVVLFYKGNWNPHILQNCISVVGTRNITSYGHKITTNICSFLAQTGYTIVSGMAMGVDKIAHLSTLDSKGSTIAVLASSVNVPSPYTNVDVYKRILESGGLILSEVFPGTAMKPGLFAYRNRILAGLSSATVVIEAAKKSGALITAKIAFETNRLVFAVPGNVGNTYSVGTNMLIKNGMAKLVEDANDILIEFGHSPVQMRQTDISTLEEIDRVIYNTILAEAKTADEIALEIGKTVSFVLGVCSKLEILGILKKSSDGKYYIN